MVVSMRLTLLPSSRRGRGHDPTSRQVALVARDLDAVVGELCEHPRAHGVLPRPGVAALGLRNALMVIGDQFLEVVSPTQPGTTAGRLLDKRIGDGGYMAIYEVDDLDRREAQLAANGVRVVWRGDFDDIRRHLHPADVGGAIVSLDHSPHQRAQGWPSGGPTTTTACQRIAGVVWRHRPARDERALAAVRATNGDGSTATDRA